MELIFNHARLLEMGRVIRGPHPSADLILFLMMQIHTRWFVDVLVDLIKFSCDVISQTVPKTTLIKRKIKTGNTYSYRHGIIIAIQTLGALPYGKYHTKHPVKLNGKYTHVQNNLKESDNHIISRRLR